MSWQNSQQTRLPVRPAEMAGTFTGGTIAGVAVDISDEAFVDLEKDAQAAWARE